MIKKVITSFKEGWSVAFLALSALEEQKPTNELYVSRNKKLKGRNGDD